MSDELSFEPEDLEEQPARLIITPGDGEGMMTLRDYQVEAVDSCFDAWLEYDAVMTVLATGLGKTVLASDIVLRWPAEAGRVLFIAHIQELIFQAQEKIGLHTEEIPAIEMGIYKEGTSGHGLLDRSKCLVASIQTLLKRKEKFDPSHFGLIIIDEFHHAGSQSYRSVWDYFKKANPNIKLLGITATPYRGDNISLACLAETCCFEMGIREGIDTGWLVPIEQQYIVVDELDFTSCRTVAQDLNEGDLESVMLGATVDDGMTEAQRLEALEKQERMLHAIAVPTVREARGRTTLVFCVTVAHAERMAEVLRRYPGVTAEFIHGKTPPEERKDIIARFKAGSIQMLVGVGCFTEGFDAPNVEVVAMARPTKKLGLYVQMVGRGTRPLPGLVDKYNTPEERQVAIANSRKSTMTVLDFVGNSGRHKLISTADVLAGDMPPELVEAAVKELKETGQPEDIRNAVWRKQKERDEEQARKEEERKRRIEEQRLFEEGRRAKLRAEAEYRATVVNPFGQHAVPDRVQPKFRGGSSDGQVAYLKKLGIAPEVAMTWSKQQAGSVISKLKGQRGADYIVTFGKWQGKRLRDLPSGYLRWMKENCTDNRELQNHIKAMETYTPN